MSRMLSLSASNCFKLKGVPQHEFRREGKADAGEDDKAGEAIELGAAALT